MKKIMLVCNAGMSTGMLAKRIQEASEGTMEVHAYGAVSYTHLSLRPTLVFHRTVRMRK